MIRFSIVIPTYNEEEGIERTIRTVISECKLIESEFEICIIDDDSTDNTRAIVTGLSTVFGELQLIHRVGMRSLGESIGQGIRFARGEVIVVMDSDLTHNPKYIDSLLKIAEKDLFAIGSRFVTRNRAMISRKHFWASKIFNLIIRRILGISPYDNLSGFWSFKRKYLADLSHENIFFGYGDYFFRLVYFIERNRHRVKEIPIVYTPRSFGKSKSNFPILFFRYSLRLIQFRMKWSGL